MFKGREKGTGMDCAKWDGENGKERVRREGKKREMIKEEGKKRGREEKEKRKAVEGNGREERRR